MPSMAGDGANVLDLSMENTNNTEHNIVGDTKKNRTQRSQNKKQTAKGDSDLKIVAGQKFEKKLKIQSKLSQIWNLNLSLKPSWKVQRMI